MQNKRLRIVHAISGEFPSLLCSSSLLLKLTQNLEYYAK